MGYKKSKKDYSFQYDVEKKIMYIIKKIGPEGKNIIIKNSPFSESIYVYIKEPRQIIRFSFHENKEYTDRLITEQKIIYELIKQEGQSKLDFIESIESFIYSIIK